MDVKVRVIGKDLTEIKFIHGNIVVEENMDHREMAALIDTLDDLRYELGSIYEQD